MKLEYLYLPDVFGETPSADSISAVVQKLSKIDAISDEVRFACGKSNVKKKCESLGGLYLLSKMQDLNKILIKRDKNGRPFAEGGNFDFNVSHSEDLAVCAVSSGRVGVDAEKVHPVPERERFAARYFCANEIAYIESAPDKDEAFFRIWTRKEALLKLTGDGLTKNLKELDTTADAKHKAWKGRALAVVRSAMKSGKTVLMVSFASVTVPVLSKRAILMCARCSSTSPPRNRTPIFAP